MWAGVGRVWRVYGAVVTGRLERRELQSDLVSGSPICYLAWYYSGCKIRWYTYSPGQYTSRGSCVSSLFLHICASLPSATVPFALIPAVSSQGVHSSPGTIGGEVLAELVLSAKHKMAVTAATVLSWVTRKVLGEPKPVRLSTTSARVNVGEGCVGPPPPEDCKKGTPEQETCPEMPFKTPAAVSPRRASVPLLLNGMPPRFVFAALPCDRSRLQNTAPC